MEEWTIHTGQQQACAIGLLPQVRSISEELGIAFLGVGFDPKWLYEDVPKMPKARCAIAPVLMCRSWIQGPAACLLPPIPPPAPAPHQPRPQPALLRRPAGRLCTLMPLR